MVGQKYVAVVGPHKGQVCTVVAEQAANVRFRLNPGQRLPRSNRGQTIWMTKARFLAVYRIYQ